MRNRLFLSILIIALSGLAFQSVQADSYTDLSITDAESVDDAVAQITATLENRSFEIVLIVDHAAAAKSVGLELRPTQVIFARPHRIVERFLLKRSHTLGIDLPMKFLVFEDEQGAIQVSSNPAGYLVDRHDIKIVDPLLRWLQLKADQFSQAPEGLVTLASNLDFASTVENLKAAIPAPPFRFPLDLDYDAGQRAKPKHRGRRLPFLIVFGNPNVGTLLMQTDQRIGLDLPQKFLVWEDRDGGVHITWNDPFFIAARYNIQGQDPLLEAVANALNNFAQIGAGN